LLCILTLPVLMHAADDMTVDMIIIHSLHGRPIDVADAMMSEGLAKLNNSRHESALLSQVGLCCKEIKDIASLQEDQAVRTRADGWHHRITSDPYMQKLSSIIEKEKTGVQKRSIEEWIQSNVIKIAQYGGAYDAMLQQFVEQAIPGFKLMPKISQTIKCNVAISLDDAEQITSFKAAQLCILYKIHKQYFLNGHAPRLIYGRYLPDDTESTETTKPEKPEKAEKCLLQ
jgi:hypothetical protein